MPRVPEQLSRTPHMCRMYRQGIPVAVIASRFGVQRPAVYKALRRGGVLDPYKPADGRIGAANAEKWEQVTRAELVDRFADGLADGLSIRRAGEIVGWTPNQADGAFRRMRSALGWQAV